MKLYANPHCSSRSRHLSGRTRRFRQIFKKNRQIYKIKKVQAHREQTWRKQRRSGGEAHQMAGSGTQRFFLFMFINFFFLFLFMLCWENQSKTISRLSSVDTWDDPGCQLVPWYVVATILAKIHRARALDLHCSLLHLAACVQVVNYRGE